MTIVSRNVGTLLSRDQGLRNPPALEELFQPIPATLQEFLWGVCAVDYSFESGILIVRKLDVVMPNGFQIAREVDRLRLDLRSLPAGDHVVYLTLMLLPPNEANRFLSSDPRVTPDEVLGDDGLELPRVRSRLALVTTLPASQDRSLPLLKVTVRRRNGTDQKDGDWSAAMNFVPPMLKVRPDTILGKRCLSIADRLRRESDALTRRLNSGPPTLATVEARAQLGPLVGALAGFGALLTGQPHPFTLYVELCRLAGAVAVLRREPVPVSPPYDHSDAWAVFDTVARSFAPASAVKVKKFTFQREGQLFRLPPDDGWTHAAETESAAQSILAVESAASEELVRQWGENCVIGNRSRMPQLESRRILGPSRTYLKHAEGIPADHRTALFAVTPDANMQASNEDLLVLGSTPEVAPTALHLYVLNANGDRDNV